MKMILVFFAFFAVCLAAPCVDPIVAALSALPVLEQEEVYDEFGQYSFRYVGAEGTVISEQGQLAPSSNSEDHVFVVKGEVSYIDDKGKICTQKYTAATKPVTNNSFSDVNNHTLVNGEVNTCDARVRNKIYPIIYTGHVDSFKVEANCLTEASELAISAPSSDINNHIFVNDDDVSSTDDDGKIYPIKYTEDVHSFNVQDDHLSETAEPIASVPFCDGHNHALVNDGEVSYTGEVYSEKYIGDSDGFKVDDSHRSGAPKPVTVAFFPDDGRVFVNTGEVSYVGVDGGTYTINNIGDLDSFKVEDNPQLVFRKPATVNPSYDHRNVLVTKGELSYIGDDGKTYSIEYTGDVDEFQVEENHRSTAPKPVKIAPSSDESDVLATEGEVSYIGDDGKIYTIKYTGE